MKLRWQLVGAFGFAAVVPILVGGYGTRRLIHDRYQTEFAERAQRVRRDLQAQLEQGLAGERVRVQQFCEGDVLVDKLLTDLAAGREPDLQEHLVAAMNGRGLDTLAVIDPRGRVLGSGHLPGAVSSTDRDTLALARARDAQRFVIRKVRVRVAGEGVRPVLALEYTCAVERLGRKVFVVGGVLFKGVVGRLTNRNDAQVFVLDDTGRVIDATPRAHYPPKLGYPRRDIALPNPDGGVPATITIAVPDEALHQDIESLERQLLVALCAGLGLSLLLALAIGRQVAAPLDRLSRGVSAIAQGNLDQRIDVRGSTEVMELVDAFNRMAKDLKATRSRMLRAERIAAWREIARRIAHEIKNPLFPIQTSIETLRKTYRAAHPEFGEIFEEATSTVLEEVERLKRIVTEFSQFARMPKPKAQQIAIEEVIGHVVGLFSGGPGPSVHSQIEGTLPQIRADREQLIQVLLNLVQNARDAVEDRPGPIVRVEAARAPDGLALRVIDNGSGIPEEIRGRMFEPYFTTKETGTGLGLAIVQRIVTEHGGGIDVACRAEGGTIVTVTLTEQGPPPSPDESQGERESLGGTHRDSGA